MRFLFFILVFGVFTGCDGPPAVTGSAAAGPAPADYFVRQDSGVQSGNIKMVEISTPKGKFHVWTKRFGYNPRIKVLLLHGGPGGTHELFECMENFLAPEGIEFIYYDQLESFYSDQPNDSSLWTPEHFVEEVDQVRQALGSAFVPGGAVARSGAAGL